MHHASSRTDLNLELPSVFQLDGLQHLDISDDKQFTSDVARQLLEKPDILPALISLDVSGRKQVTDAAVRAFVEQRPGMTFVGLLATDAGFSDFLSGEGTLKVGSPVTLNQ